MSKDCSRCRRLLPLDQFIPLKAPDGGTYTKMCFRCRRKHREAAGNYRKRRRSDSGASLPPRPLPCLVPRPLQDVAEDPNASAAGVPGNGASLPPRSLARLTPRPPEEPPSFCGA
ncbi:hypothetical protein VTN31DRAFT_5592 [Thermomyces dupontii]|uniref:uncharacterized protein n=1 Tax=Talaromyces thermophilus TaxID=28565 RepID=UPI003741FACE